MNRGTLAMLLLVLCVGLGAGWWYGRPAVVVETAKPAETQKDGSIKLAVAPDAKAKPAHQTPKGARVERIGSITVQGITPPEIRACTSVPCPPVTVKTSLVRTPDGQKRVIVSSPDGQIIDGVDIPIETAAAPPDPPKWAVGLSLDPIRQTPGIWIERDIWRVRAGAEINQVKQRTDSRSSAELRLRLGWTF